MVELVSVVIPTRNRCARLLNAVASVREQSGVELEIIVVDDASSDGTQHAMDALCQEEPRLRYIRNPYPLGGGGARNAGAALAKGAFISFLDDDDYFLPGKLATQVAALLEQTGAPAASSSFMIDYGNNRQTLKQITSPVERDELLRANVLGGASVCMVRQESFRMVGGFDPQLPSCQDWDLWLKLHLLGAIAVCKEPLVRYCFHTDVQITGNSRAEYRGRRRIHLKYVGEMSPDLRCASLAALIFYRRVRFGVSASRRISGLVSIMRLTSGAEAVLYLWRAVRLMVHSKWFQESK